MKNNKLILCSLSILSANLAHSKASKAPAEPPKAAQTQTGNKSENEQSESVKDQLLVSFKDAEAAKGRSQIFEKYKAKEIEKVGSSPLYLIELPLNSDLKKMKEEISKEPGVRYAEPNLKMRIMK